MRQRVLFVDDERNVLDALRRLLRSQREVWEMDFVAGAADALARMTAAPFDVLVTDLKMPGMSGVELLEQVKTRWPQTVRIALSGHADEAMITRAMSLVHQYLHKPTDSETIKAAVARCCDAQKGLRNERMRATVMGCDTLPSPPTLCMELTQAVESENSDSRKIAAIISRDVAISAKILQLVNSSFFGLGRRVSSVEQTVTLLGVMRIRALVLAEQLLKQFSPPAELAEFCSGRFWRHAMTVGELSRTLSKAAGQTGDRPDQAFTAGLLHDIGKLVLASRDPGSYREVLRLARECQEPLVAIEKRILSASHGEIGGQLLGIWGLPERIVEAIAFHHEPRLLDFRGPCALLAVHAADALTVQLEGDAPAQNAILDEKYLDECGVRSQLDKWQQLAVEAWEKHGSAAAAPA